MTAAAVPSGPSRAADDLDVEPHQKLLHEKHDGARRSTKLPKVERSAISTEGRCIYFTLEEMVTLVRMLLSQLGTHGFLTATHIDWKPIEAVLKKPAAECEYALWHFERKHYRKSLRLVVMEFDISSIWPVNGEHEKELERFRTLLTGRMERLLQFIERAEKTPPSARLPALHGQQLPFPTPPPTATGVAHGAATQAQPTAPQPVILQTGGATVASVLQGYTLDPRDLQTVQGTAASYSQLVEQQQRYQAMLQQAAAAQYKFLSTTTQGVPCQQQPAQFVLRPETIQSLMAHASTLQQQPIPQQFYMQQQQYAPHYFQTSFAPYIHQQQQYPQYQHQAQYMQHHHAQEQQQQLSMYGTTSPTTSAPSRGPQMLSQWQQHPSSLFGPQIMHQQQQQQCLDNRSSASGDHSMRPQEQMPGYTSDLMQHLRPTIQHEQSDSAGLTSRPLPQEVLVHGVTPAVPYSTMQPQQWTSGAYHGGDAT